VKVLLLWLHLANIGPRGPLFPNEHYPTDVYGADGTRCRKEKYSQQLYSQMKASLMEVFDLILGKGKHRCGMHTLRRSGKFELFVF
jgi:hypothetical protein